MYSSVVRKLNITEDLGYCDFPYINLLYCYTTDEMQGDDMCLRVVVPYEGI
jgi:hypothetical protein